MKVLDASVIVKWYRTEKGTDKAIKIRDGYKNGKYDIAVPDLVFLELANAIRYMEGSTVQDVHNVLDNFIKLDINIIVPTIDLIKDASSLAYEYDITTYDDAIYLSLAQNLDFEFITADNRLFKKVKSLSFVNLLTKFV